MMTLKTAAVGLPLGGGKGGVAVNPKELSPAEVEEMSRKYVQALEPHIGPDKDIPAPDVNTNATVIDWMTDEYARRTGDTTKASFTGKSLRNGGSRGREAATGRGGVIALAELLQLSGQAGKPMTVAIQGFGNVGQFFATVAQADHPEWRVVAVSDSHTAVMNTAGLDATALTDFKRSGGRFENFEHPNSTRMPASELLGLEIDILVLAALGDVIAEHNMNSVHARYVVELANGPITTAAYTHLSKEGVVIIPDIIANAGGVIVSYLEWLQNREGKQWSEQEVNQQLASYLQKAMRAVYELAESEKVPLKEAAVMIAIRELVARVP